MMKINPMKKRELVYLKKEVAEEDAAHVMDANMANAALVSSACLRSSASQRKEDNL